MPIATPEIYSEMIDRAKAGGFAFPAVNVTSSQTLNAALRGFAEAESDGIVQVSTGGAAYWSGAATKDRVAGSLGFAAFACEVAKNYGFNIALHTDHCPQDNLDGFVLPLVAVSERQSCPHVSSRQPSSSVPPERRSSMSSEFGKRSIQ